MGSKGRPYRTLVVDDFEVFVGRSAADNDTLSLKVAEPTDTWLHVAEDVAGSHVVLRNPESRAVPREVLTRCGEIAAWYSKARNRRRVRVHYCQASNVSKPRGAPAGMVEITRYRELIVEPRDPSDSSGTPES